MSKEITITMNAQITTIVSLNDVEAKRADEYIERVGGLEAWKVGVAEEVVDLIKTELPADDVIVSDVKWFERDIEDKEVADEYPAESL